MPESMHSGPDTFEVKMPKRFTFDDNHKFHLLMMEMAGSKSNMLILDMQRTEFIDSAGLGLLLLAKEKAAKSGKLITIRNPQTYVSKLFSTTRFNELFRIEQ